MKKISILGSTGSIGRLTLDVIKMYPNRFKVITLTADSNIDLLEKQVNIFKPSLVAIANKKYANIFKNRISSNVKVVTGIEGLKIAASHPEVNFVVSAISGSAGLMPTLEAIKSGKIIGLANKETIVMAGKIINKEIINHNTKIIPIDSEHSAIFQCIEGKNIEDVKKLILTASGGPFRKISKESLKNVAIKDALSHPTWNMGKKITIDSATLMNKGFEVIEAHYLFNIPAEKIKVIIHPQSIIHSLVEFKDGCMLAQLSYPDMKGPIAYALSYPERLEGVIKECNLIEIGSLTFEKPDIKKFPCLSYAYDALKIGGTATTVLNAANEMAVNAFLKGIIPFFKIPVIIEKILYAHKPVDAESIEEVLEADRWAREKFNEIMEEA